MDVDDDRDMHIPIDASEIFHDNVSHDRVKRGYRLVRKDNSSMAIFLGKNYLGQTDSSQIQITEQPPEDMDVNELYALLKKKMSGKTGGDK